MQIYNFHLTHVPENYRISLKEFSLLKEKLNSCKQKIDNVYCKKYTRITDIIRLHDNLRGNRGMIKKLYNAEIVTNAWMKMWELSEFIYIPPNFRSFHIAEAPGNFILALNHRIRSEYPKTKWTWVANSYILPGKNYIYDNYGLIKNYPDNWDFGADGSGDITSVENLRAWNNQENYDLLTSDVKYVPEVIDFDEEEKINETVHLAHIIATLCTVRPEGRYILKHLTLFERNSLVMLQILNFFSRKMVLIKPETSRPANSEVYITGILKTQPDSEYKELLFTLLESPDYRQKYFDQFILDRKFIYNIYTSQCKLVDLQISEINRNIKLFHKYKNHRYNEISYEMYPKRQKTAKAWLEKYKINFLKDNYKLLL